MTSAAMHMHKNLGSFERLVRLALGAFSLFAAAALFENPLAKIACVLFGAFALWEYGTGWCPLHAALGGSSSSDPLSHPALRLLGLAAVQGVMAFAWFDAGWEKVTNPEFATGVGKTLAYFASNNPFPWYKAFLLGPATAQSALFGLAVEWGELAVGVALAVAMAGLLVGREAKRRQALVVSSAALALGMIMNANFYFAAGWTGAGTKGDNVVMFWVQGVLLYVWLSSYFSGSRPKAPAQRKA